VIDTGKPELDANLLVHYGVKGMKWGKTTERKASDAHNKNVRQTLRKKKFTDDEIRAARTRQAARAEKYQKAIDRSGGKYTKEIADAQHEWREQDDRYTANRKTVGEKRVATVLGGPIGRYLVSDARTTTRLANEAPVQWNTGKDRAQSVLKNAAVGGLLVAAVAGGRR